MFMYIRAFWQLLRFQYYVVRADFARLYQEVRKYPYSPRLDYQDFMQRICGAMDVACVVYPRQVLCLQRSAATACLLRKYGVPAQMVIGVQKLPFRAHAWVEVDGRVVNDKPYMREMYTVLDRC
jgi:hypothetical protein